MWWGKILPFLMLTACAGTVKMSDDFAAVTVNTSNYDIFTYQKITDKTSPIHIYIEGDGRAFNGRGRPTLNPTPRGDFVRRLAVRDGASNVVYMARPCQYVISAGCGVADWTHGRFSHKVIDSMTSAVKQVAGNRPVVLIGYSGGAMISGLIVQNNPDLNIKKWITIAGVLNHSDWTKYFGDAPLYDSLNMSKLPNINQLHYIADGDTTVPNMLSIKWTGGKNLIIVPNASHSEFSDLELSFD